MVEIVVLSGKGGTGKTSLTGSFAALASRAIVCDLDVDAPDLHLLLSPRIQRREEFYSGNLAVIDPSLCDECGVCLERCRYGAIAQGPQGPAVDEVRCEGCKVCVHFCPNEAIAFPSRHCGQWFISQTRFGPLVHAQLFPGAENSGRLVTLLRQEARRLAQERGSELILCDGAPGIGCPVISSLAGSDLVVAVSEPTPSGRHDLERLVELSQHFTIDLAVLINKADLNYGQARAIAAFCQRQGLPMLGEIPHDVQITQAMVRGQVISELPEGPTGRLLKGIWRRIEEMAQAAAASKDIASFPQARSLP